MTQPVETAKLGLSVLCSAIKASVPERGIDKFVHEVTLASKRLFLLLANFFDESLSGGKIENIYNLEKLQSLFIEHCALCSGTEASTVGQWSDEKISSPESHLLGLFAEFKFLGFWIKDSTSFRASTAVEHPTDDVVFSPAYPFV